MNILIVVDKNGSAIHRLALSVKKHNPHFNIKVFPVHPKRNDADTLFEAQQLIRWCDLIDVHYWKSGEVLRSTFPVEFGQKKKILCHFNPYDLDKLKWQDIYDAVIVGNQEMANHLPAAHLIPYAVDLSFFTYQPLLKNNNIVNMVVGRIEGKKGVREVAQICRELNYKLKLVGRVSDLDYMRQVMTIGGDSLEFIENASEEKLREVYYESTVHICNSIDNFESGTLPVLEAMACGVPVLTRNVGHIPDLYNGKNMIVRKGKTEDIEDLKKELKALMENNDLLLRLRESAFKTIKNRNDRKMARQFSKLYYKTLRDDRPLVSLIIPTKDRGEPILECLAAAVTQSYEHYEIILVDSGLYSIENLVRKLRSTTNISIKYVRFSAEGYTLAEARNRGIIESEGEILVFCDDRLQLDSKAIENFAVASKQNCWLWGIKDDAEKPFVENLSSIRREDVIRAGMFNERIQWYGGMSEEIRTRFTKLGYAFELIQKARAKSIVRSGNRNDKRHGIIESKLLLFKLYG